MGLLDKILHLKDEVQVTLLADGYVILDKKERQCIGIYKTLDMLGQEVLFHATELTSQKIITVAELKDLAKGHVIHNNSNCAIECSGITSRGYFSNAIGWNVTASGNVATAIGYRSQALANYSTSIGFATISSGNSSISMGQSATASGEASTSMGYETHANGKYSIAMGNNTTASGEASIAMGLQTTASANYSISIGKKLTVIKQFTLGNGGPIYGEGLYSKLDDWSGNNIPNDSSNCITKLNKLLIYKSVINQNDYTIDTSSGASQEFFDVSMIDYGTKGLNNKAVNITQLVYTLVGAVQELQYQIKNLKNSSN